MFAGRPTEVGLRGNPVVQTIAAAGVESQRSEVVLKRLFGDTVDGLDALGLMELRSVHRGAAAGLR